MYILNSFAASQTVSTDIVYTSSISISKKKMRIWIVGCLARSLKDKAAKLTSMQFAIS